MERLAISRGQKRVEFIFRPVNMKMCSQMIICGTMLKSVFESEYIEQMVARTKFLGLHHSEVSSDRVVIESTNDLVEISAMVISVDCWIGNWLNL